MQPVFGLYTHIQANRRRSVALAIGLCVLVNGLAFGLSLLARGLGFAGDDTFTGHVTAALHDLLWAGPVATALTGLWVLIALRAHGWIIDSITGARAIERRDDPRLYALLENLCISRGMTMPSLKVLETGAVNAFASGLDAGRASVTVTRGLLDSLDEAELEAVLAHELTHIRNEDVRLMVVAVIVTGIFSLVGELIFRGGRHARVSLGHSRNSSGSERKKDGGGAIPAILLALLVIAIAWLLSQVIRHSLSRSREYMADAGAVELTKDPDALIRALLKIQGRGELEGVPSGIMDMCVDNPSSGFVDLFSSHPSIADRIDALVRYAGGRAPPTADAPGPEAAPWGAAQEI